MNYYPNQETKTGDNNWPAKAFALGSRQSGVDARFDMQTGKKDVIHAIFF
ncbi:MAG: hypothetical protein ACR2LL_06485 [Nitrosopumilus sp.]